MGQKFLPTGTFARSFAYISRWLFLFALSFGIVPVISNAATPSGTLFGPTPNGFATPDPSNGRIATVNPMASTSGLFCCNLDLDASTHTMVLQTGAAGDSRSSWKLNTVKDAFDTITVASEDLPRPFVLEPSPVVVLSPFLLGAIDLGNLDLATLLPKLSSLASATATGLAADETSAAIVVFPVSTRAPVTFTTNNGTQLLNYVSAFMQSSPQGGSAELQVVPKRMGSSLYAVALLQTPPAGVTPAYATPITITAQQEGGQVRQTTLPLVPPPVLLVHGLWGTKNSLSYYLQYLRANAPWSTYPTLVQEISYPGALSFDSTKSIVAIDKARLNALNTAWSKGFVASRVDAVAHSMGGLLIRSYSNIARSTTPYLTVKNRKQGWFHTIITLDTPETGSGLANYLLKQKKATLQATYASDPLAWYAWRTTCGTDASTTVAECFANPKLNRPVNGGAVESLTLDSSQLEKAPSPIIPNTTWLDVSATNTSSIERNDLNYLLRALYASQSKASSVDAEVGTPNDDIVQLSSQIANAPVYVTFDGLSHTNAEGDPSVVNSSAVAATAACRLRDPTSPQCQSLALVANQGTTAKPTHRSVGRLVVVAPSSAWLGEPLKLRVSAAGVRSFHVEQVGLQRRPGYDVSESDDFAVTDAMANSTELTIVPKVFGRVVINVTAKFADGSYDRDSSGDVRVSLNPKDFLALRADEFNSSLAISETGGGMIDPVIDVRGSTRPIDVAAFTTWRMVSPTENPPLKITGDGMMTSVHSGEAVVEGAFDGHEIIANVRVDED